MNRLILGLGISFLFAASARAGVVEIKNVSASSEYSEGETNYPVRNLKDSKSATAWFEGESGNGLGSWVELDLGGERNLTRLVIYAGDWKSSGDWSRANRPKSVELKFSDESTATMTLTDEMVPQVFVPPGGKRTSTVRIKVKEIFGGSAFPDTAISEVRLFDDGPSAWFEPKAITASSEFPPEGETYYATNANDGLVDTYWCEGDKAGDGAGQWLMFDFGAPVNIKTMDILNGMGGSVDLHKKGNAATKVTLTFSDGSTKALDLMPFPLMKKVEIGPKQTSSVKVTFDAIRKGTEFNDLCMSEIRFSP